MSYNIEFKFNVKEIEELAKKYPETYKSEAKKLLQLINSRIESTVVEKTPRGVGGAAGLAGSIAGEVVSYGMKFTGIVGTSLEYAEPVEYGRSSGKQPPTEALVPWVKSILGISSAKAQGVAYAIALKIAADGTDGAFMFYETYNELESWIESMMESLPSRIVANV